MLLAEKEKLSADPALIRLINRTTVLQILREESPLSMTAIWKKSGLSRVAVMGIIKELKDKELVEEVGEAASTGGRRAELIRFNPGAFWIVAVDIFKRLVTLTDLSAAIRAEISVPCDLNREPQDVLRQMIEGIQTLLLQENVDRSRILGIGVSVPGEVDFEAGLLVLSTELNWRNVPIKETVETATGIRTMVDNDVRMRAMGEHLFGLGRGIKNLVCLDVGQTGLGAAGILNGRLFRGEHNSMGEIGHISIVRDGPACNCGNCGCLEKYTTGQSMALRVREMIRGGRKTKILDLAGQRPEAVTLDHIFQSATVNDPFARQVVQDLIFYLGLAVAILINSLDPRMIILSGAVIEAGGDFLLDAIREANYQKVLTPGSRKVQIERTTVGSKAGIIGACGLVNEHIFRIPAMCS